MTRRISIVGFGNQGRAWADNLRDSGWDVSLLLRPGSPSREKIGRAGFAVGSIAKALPESSLVAVLIPDDSIPRFAAENAARFQPGQSLIFAHGFALHFKTAAWPDSIDRILVAPKGIGTAVRSEFVRGSGVPAVLAVDHDATGRAWEIADTVAEGIGSARAGTYRATAREEVEADLFSEQALLCGGIPALIAETYGALVKSGTPREIAYLECVHELKFIVDLIQTRGIHEMLNFASPTARYGGILGAKRLMSPAVREELKTILNDVKSGVFRSRLDAESAAGFPETTREMENLKAGDLETIGKEIRRRIEGEK